MDERQELAGGVANAGQVVREGDVVRRPAPPNAATLHALLHHVTANGFKAPHPVGLDGDGREVVGYIRGEVALAPYPDWAMSEAALLSVALLLRRYHDAVADFVVPQDASWNHELADPAGGDVVCHNDVCIENVIFDNGVGSALIDFDFAAPGRTIWDVAMTARYWVPLTDPALAAEVGRPEFDPFRRVAAYSDSYGLTDEQRREFMTVLMEIEEVALRFVEGRVEAGHEPFVKMWLQGGRERRERKMRWLDAHADRLAATVA